jgi:hypothetical protein
MRRICRRRRTFDPGTNKDVQIGMDPVRNMHRTLENDCLRCGTHCLRAPKERQPAPPKRKTETLSLLPNLLPLPTKTSPKQDEPRANKESYVIEIYETA